MKTIESLDQWNKLAVKLSAHGYSIWQMQYDTQHPEGFHAWFCKLGKKQDYEVVTYNAEVQDAIVKYKV